VLVVTQPARPSGRGRSVRQPPVAEWAEARSLNVLQPSDVREPEFLDRLAVHSPTTAVVVAFGQIFPKALLQLPVRGCINVHASLLPRYRGAAPIQAAIIAGEQTTGVTTMLMEEGLDTGPILLQRELDIGQNETAGELAARLSEAGAELLLTTLEVRDQGRLEPRPQQDSEATLAPRLRRRDGIIDWNLEAVDIFNLMRGLTPWPGVSSSLRGQPVKVLWGRPVEGAEVEGSDPGTILGNRDDRLLVSCGRHSVFGIERLQRAGRKPLPASAFANGERLEAGERFG